VRHAHIFACAAHFAARAMPDVVAALAPHAFEIDGGSNTDRFAALAKEDLKRWIAVAKSANIEAGKAAIYAGFGARVRTLAGGTADPPAAPAREPACGRRRCCRPQAG